MKYALHLFVCVLALKLSMAQTQSTHSIEINFDFSFGSNLVKITYLISPPPAKETVEYTFRPYSISDFRSFVLKPREKVSYTLSNQKLSLQHNGNLYQKYQFYSEISIDQLIQDQLLVPTSTGYLFSYSDLNASKIFPIPNTGKRKLSISVCTDIKATASGISAITFTDKKSEKICLFAQSVSEQELTKMRISFDKAPVVAVTTPPTRRPATSFDEERKEQTPPKEETFLTYLKSNSCNTIHKSAINTLCTEDSMIIPTEFFPPFNTHYYLITQSSSDALKCLRQQLASCPDADPDALQFILAYEVFREIFQKFDTPKATLTLRNIVDNHTKNTGFYHPKRLYFLGFIHNVFFHNGLEGVEQLFKAFSQKYNSQEINTLAIELKLKTDFKELNVKAGSFLPINLRYELKYKPKNGGYTVSLSDQHQLLKPKTPLTWILYLKNQSIDTVTVYTSGASEMQFDLASESEILFVYPMWEERLLLPTIEIRPDFHAILELNNGYTPLNRYRSFRTMAATGNPNLLATAVSLALDDSLPQIRNFGFDRLDEVSEYQVNKIKDGLLRALKASDAFTRPTGYRNAERFALQVNRPVISDQKGYNLYADLLVLKQFEGPKAIDMALESLIEGNNDEGLIWFLAENGEREVLELLITFESGIKPADALKRLLVVNQATQLRAEKDSASSMPGRTELFKKLTSAGLADDVSNYILNNVESNTALFKASFTTK